MILGILLVYLGTYRNEQGSVHQYGPNCNPCFLELVLI